MAADPPARAQPNARSLRVTSPDAAPGEYHPEAGRPRAAPDPVDFEGDQKYGRCGFARSGPVRAMVPGLLLVAFDWTELTGGPVVQLIISLAILVLMIASLWKVFEKAGEPGWAAIVPIYNIIVMLKISGKPIWWIILFLIPVVNFIISILVAIGIARNFGKSDGFGVGLALLAIVFYPMLAFSDATFTGQKTA